jgi:class 3 adenylate cyclase
VARLEAVDRTKLRDSAFAYVESSGRRRLPIHDEAHVRNALARFSQVLFEDDVARDKARTRLLRAAKRYGIVPIGFLDGQLRAQRLHGLPSGAVTFLMTDIQDSTGLLHRLGDLYPRLLTDSRRIIRRTVNGAGGREVDARADEFFAAFKRAPEALGAALAIHRGLGEHRWPDGAEVCVRIGIHSGRPTLTETGYVGLAVHAVNRICAEGDGGQIILSSASMRALGGAVPVGVVFTNLGERRLRGLPEVETLYLVEV